MPINKEIHNYMSKLGKKGGSVKSDAKKKASRITLAKARAIRWQYKQQKTGNVGKKEKT